MTPLRTLLPILFLAACGGGGGAMMGPEIRETFTKPAGSGDGQSGVVGTTLTLSLSAQVTVDGAPVPGVIVTFAPVAGSGTVTPAVDTTDGAGLASRPWTLGTTAGPQSVKVTAVGFANTLTYNAAATPGAVASLAIDSGDAQLQEPNTTFTRALRVVTRDQFGNRVAGVPVAWGVAAGSGVVNPGAATVTAVDGTASATVTAGNSAGALTIRTTAASLPADTATFHLTVTPVANVIDVASNFFSPAHDTIPVGGAVRWVWVNGQHNVGQTAGPAEFPGSQLLTAPSSYGPVLFTTPGTYVYECSIHQNMSGTITVQ